MIEALATHHANFLSLEIIYPDKKPHEFTKITGGDHKERYAHALRLIHFKSRDFILAKLTGWLKQRMYSLDLTAQAQRSKEGAQLLILMNYHKDRGFHRLCQLVSDNADTIKSLAPSERSKHYNHYEKMILPIVKYCRDMVQN